MEFSYVAFILMAEHIQPDQHSPEKGLQSPEIGLIRQGIELGLFHKESLANDTSSEKRLANQRPSTHLQDSNQQLVATPASSNLELMPCTELVPEENSAAEQPSSEPSGSPLFPPSPAQQESGAESQSTTDCKQKRKRKGASQSLRSSREQQGRQEPCFEVRDQDMGLIYQLNSSRYHSDGSLLNRKTSSENRRANRRGSEFNSANHHGSKRRHKNRSSTSLDWPTGDQGRELFRPFSHHSLETVEPFSARYPSFKVAPPPAQPSSEFISIPETRISISDGDADPSEYSPNDTSRVKNDRACLLTTAESPSTLSSSTTKAGVRIC